MNGSIILNYEQLSLQQRKQRKIITLNGSKFLLKRKPTSNRKTASSNLSLNSLSIMIESWDKSISI